MTTTCSMPDCEKPMDARELCGTHYRRLRRHGDPTFTQRTVHTGTPSERFWKRVDKSNECWIWTGKVARNGYGLYSVGKVTMIAHRYAYEQVVGEISEGMQLDHICHNRTCVNPGHLRQVTNKQNNENPAGLRVDNTSGYRGVGFDQRSGRWYASAQHNGKKYSAGGHETQEEAAEAARQLRLSLFTHNDADRRPRTRGRRR